MLNYLQTSFDSDNDTFNFDWSRSITGVVSMGSVNRDTRHSYEPTVFDFSKQIDVGLTDEVGDSINEEYMQAINSTKQFSATYSTDRPENDLESPKLARDRHLLLDRIESSKWKGSQKEDKARIENIERKLNALFPRVLNEEFDELGAAIDSFSEFKNFINEITSK